MAKAGFALHGARGKIGPMVAQKGSDGGTVLREHVKPTNPQTIAQMCQRIAFAVTTRAAATMITLVDHAFEGVPVGKKCRRQFVKMNVARIKNLGVAQVNDPSIIAPGAFCPKGLNVITPNPYIISRGSITRNDYFKIFYAHTTDALTSPKTLYLGRREEQEVQINTVDLDSGDKSPITYREFLHLLGFMPGDELSLVLISALDATPIYGENQWGEGVRNDAFSAYRIVFKGEDDLLGDGITWNDNVNLTDGISTIIDNMVNAALTSATFLNTFKGMLEITSEGADDPDFLVVTGYDLANSEATPTQAAATIVSRYQNGVEKRSNEDFVVIDTAAGNAKWYGLSAPNAIASYQSAEDVGSDLFLDQGGDNILGAANP